MRSPLTAMTLLLLAWLGMTADAAAGTYVVRQCHQAPAENRSHEAGSVPAGPYTIVGGPTACESAANGFALGVTPAADALDGQSGRVRFTAPLGTELVRVEVDALLRREQGHAARLDVTGAAGGSRITFASGGSAPTNFAHYTWPTGSGYGAPRRNFQAGLFCTNPGGGCAMDGSGDRSKALIRNVRMTLRDVVAPTVEDEWRSG